MATNYDQNGSSSPQNTDGNSDELERHIIKRFEIQDRLGKGAYGIVWKAYDRKEGRVVALKKIFDAFGNGQDAQRTFREVCFLTSFSVHPNIIKLTDIIRAENLNDLYLSFEYMPTDLHALIKSKNGLQDVHIRYIMAQLFRTVYFIHSANVIHRDLKPANILLTHPCEIRVADFGLARSLSDPDDNFQNGNLTNYVATRWYRSPEILLGSKRYTKGVDIWSLGTILAEMLRGRPLFTGENTIEQINFIRGALAEPTSQDLRYCDTALVRSVFNYPPHRDFRRPLESYMRGSPPEAIDLIRRLLHWDPDKRIDLMKAMRHPYVNGYYDPHLVYISDIAVTPFISDDKHFDDPSIYREALYEILHVKEVAKTPRTAKSVDSPKHNQLDPENDDITLRSDSPPASNSSPDYAPLHTPVTAQRAQSKKTDNTPVKLEKQLSSSSVTAIDEKHHRPIPFGEAVGPGGHPVKRQDSNSGGWYPRTTDPRTPYNGNQNARQRLVATIEQPAVKYKTASSNNLQEKEKEALAKMNTNGSLANGLNGRKAVKFEDEVPAKKPPKEKGHGEGDATMTFAKRFSFDGRAIRDRLPYVKRSNSLARTATPEVVRKSVTSSELKSPDKKSLKDSWRDTLSKSTVPEFFKRTGSRRGMQQSSSVNTINGNLPEPTRGLNASTTVNGHSFAPGLKNSATAPQIRPQPSRNDSYGTLRTGLLNNLKSYGRG